MVLIQWIREATPLARNIIRKVMRASHAQKLEERKLQAMAEVLDTSKPPDENHLVMKTREIFEAAVKMEEGIIPTAPYEGGQFLKQHNTSNPRPPPPPYPGHVLRSVVCVSHSFFCYRLLTFASQLCQTGAD
jgi:hypothetical protein